MTARVRRVGTEVVIFVRLSALLGDGQVCDLSPASVLLFPDRIAVNNIERESVAKTSTHLYRRPSDDLQGKSGRRCRCCGQRWLRGTRFCLEAKCTTALEPAAVRDVISALPADERDERFASRYGLPTGGMRRKRR